MSTKHASLFTREHVLGMIRDNRRASWHVKNDKKKLWRENFQIH